MQAEDIRQLLDRQPFRPLRITLTDGRTVEIRQRELAMVLRTMLVVGLPAPDEREPIYDRSVTLSYEDIINVETQQPAATS